MAFDYAKLKQEVDDLQKTVEGQTSARTGLVTATANSATVAANCAKAQAEADDLLQKATVASKVADELVVKQVNYLVKLLTPTDGEPSPEDPTPDAPETPTTPTPPTV
jgi:hypothetical protein